MIKPRNMYGSAVNKVIRMTSDAMNMISTLSTLRVLLSTLYRTIRHWRTALYSPGAGKALGLIELQGKDRIVFFHP
jgi:hypothetical protein